MSLVCPCCSHPVEHDTALVGETVKCSRCGLRWSPGRVTRQRSHGESSTPAPSPEQDTQLRCPVCKTTDVRRVSLLFKQGTTSIQTGSTTIGGGTFGGHPGGGVGQTSTTGSQQSLLAKELTPPQTKAPGGGGCVLVIGVIVLVIGIPDSIWPMMLAGGLVTILGLLFLGKALEFDNNEYPKLMAAWERSFLCMRCGHRFESSL